MMTPGSVARLLGQVDTSGGPDACWHWRGHSDGHGYGKFNIYAVGAPQYVHRLVYELLIGPVPEDLTLDHTCHTFDMSCRAGDECPHRRCCNPTHLEPVTVEENARRAGRRIHTCIHGHPLTEANTYFRKDPGREGQRHCRICRRDNARRYAAERRASLVSVGVLADDAADADEGDEPEEAVS